MTNHGNNDTQIIYNWVICPMPIIIINLKDIIVYIKNSSINIIIQKMLNFHREVGYQIAR